jgi:hypothetical protein
MRQVYYLLKVYSKLESYRLEDHLMMKIDWQYDTSVVGSRKVANILVAVHYRSTPVILKAKPTSEPYPEPVPPTSYLYNLFS